MILLVEDDAISRRALQVLLQASGFRTCAVGSAEDALAIMHAGAKPNLVLIDIDLPAMSGLELLRLLQDEFPALACTLMSANEHDLSPAPGHRPVPFLPKPLVWPELLHLLQEQQTQHSAGGDEGTGRHQQN